MRRWIGPVLAAVVIGCAVHVATIVVIPQAIMRVVLRGAAANAGGVNHFLHSPRTTPQSQTVVRPSPDLAYSACSIDVSRGPVEVAINRTVAPAVVALYGQNTDTIWSAGGLVTVPGEQPNPAPLHLVITGAPEHIAPKGATAVRLQSSKALLLVRRLAPTSESFAAVDAERRKDVCAVIAPGAS